MDKIYLLLKILKEVNELPISHIKSDSPLESKAIISDNFEVEVVYSYNEQWETLIHCTDINYLLLAYSKQDNIIEFMKYYKVVKDDYIVVFSYN